MKRTTPLHERLFRRVQVDGDGCWIFTGAIDPATGYGRIGVGGRGAGVTSAHRAAYAWFWDGIPEGLHLDHLCRKRACCNPLHLEAVTQATNNLRSYDLQMGRTPTPFTDQFASPSRAYLRLLQPVAASPHQEPTHV